MARDAKAKQKTRVSSAFNALLTGAGRGDYVKERKKIFGRKSVSALARGARKYNRKKH